MADVKEALQEFDDGELYLHITPGRAQAMLDALRVALSSNKIDKRKKGVITAVCGLLNNVASGQTLERNPNCWVYVVPDIGPNGEQLTKVGHALDVDRRFARSTDRPTQGWRLGSSVQSPKL